uniref:PX domain-containing protein n=1 Tax=Pinguiococcus pyrenoidosus TaxID=172671 RepID=A0A7R9U660_9STRA
MAAEALSPERARQQFAALGGLAGRRRLFARVSNYRIRTMQRNVGLTIAPRRVVVYEIAVGTVSDSGELPFLPSIRNRLRSGAWGLGHATDARAQAGGVLTTESSAFSLDADDEEGGDEAADDEHDDEEEEDGVLVEEDDTLVYTPHSGTSSSQELAKHVSGVQSGAAVWRIERRYNDFKTLHDQIRGQVRAEILGTLPSLPEKKMMFNLDERFILKRGRALDRYLVGLLRHPVVAAMPEMRIFLSPSRPLPVSAAAIHEGANSTAVVHIGRVVSEDLLREEDTSDDASEAIAAHPVARGVHNPGPKTARPSGRVDGPRSVSESDLQQTRGRLRPTGHLQGNARAAQWPKFRFNPFELQACEAAVFGLATELFQLNRSGIARRSTIHLVRRAASVLFSSSMISALEARYQSLSTSARLSGFVRWVRGKIFPDGRFMGARQPPSEEERASTRNSLCASLPGALPSAITTLVGYNTALTGAMHFYEFIQCPVLLRSVVYTLLDLFWCELFPDMSRNVHGMRAIAKR